MKAKKSRNSSEAMKQRTQQNAKYDAERACYSPCVPRHLLGGDSVDVMYFPLKIGVVPQKCSFE